MRRVRRSKSQIEATGVGTGSRPEELEINDKLGAARASSSARGCSRLQRGGCRLPRPGRVPQRSRPSPASGSGELEARIALAPQPVPAAGHRRAERGNREGARARGTATPFAGPGGAPAGALAGGRRGDGDACYRGGRGHRTGRERAWTFRRRTRKLVVEARIQPAGRSWTWPHRTPARCGSAAFDAPTTPLLPAKVVFVSPDRVTDKDGGASWFVGYGRGRRRRRSRLSWGCGWGSACRPSCSSRRAAGRCSSISPSRWGCSHAARCASRDQGSRARTATTCWMAVTATTRAARRRGNDVLIGGAGDNIEIQGFQAGADRIDLRSIAGEVNFDG